MSDNIPPTVELLVKELKDVTNWYVFGAYLGIPVSKLDSIKKEISDIEEQKVKMFEFWSQYKVGASWKMVIQALEQNDYLVLAATLSTKYLLSNTSEKDQVSSSTEPDESVAVIRATAAVVRRLRDLETAFTSMLTDLLSLLTKCKCDLSKAQFFLDDRFDTDKFSQCTNFSTLLHQLRRGHVDTFNIYYLQQLVAYFKKDQLIERIKEYETEKEAFLKDTTVMEFQRAVVSRVEPVQPTHMKHLTIKISKELAEDRTLKDIEKLALRGFGEYQLEFIHIQVKSGSVIISWFFPETLLENLVDLAQKNAAVFKDAGVEELAVDRRVVFPEKNIPPTSLKAIYTDFYHGLVEAVSDEHTCQSLLAQLGSSALISEKKIAQLSSGKVTGSSFLKTLGLEEEPQLLVPLVSAMSRVEQIQSQAEKMSAMLKQSIAQDSVVPAKLEDKDRQQLMADIERLTRDKTDLLAKLQCYEEELKTANELLTMREKTISGMIASRDTAVKEKTSLLKEQVEELTMEGIEREGRETQMSSEIIELMSRLMANTSELNQAINKYSKLKDSTALVPHSMNSKHSEVTVSSDIGE